MKEIAWPIAVHLSGIECSLVLRAQTISKRLIMKERRSHRILTG